MFCPVSLPYKYLSWLFGADRNVRLEGHCLASLGFLHTLRSTIAFRLEYVLFYQFYAKITTFFDQGKFGTTPLLYVDVETFGGN